jgi:hypothetical protein
MMRRRVDWVAEADVSEVRVVSIFRSSALFFETSAYTNQTTRRLNPKEHNQYTKSDAILPVALSSFLPQHET